jgi:hypothetical protein
MVKRLNRVNDPASNALRESQREKGETKNELALRASAMRSAGPHTVSLLKQAPTAVRRMLY